MKRENSFSIRTLSAALSIAVFGLVSIGGMDSLQAAEKLRAAFVYFTNPGAVSYTHLTLPTKA